MLIYITKGETHWQYAKSLIQSILMVSSQLPAKEIKVPKTQSHTDIVSVH